MEWLRLIGVAVVVLGFALRLRVTVVVLAAGIVTGLVARALDGASAPGILPTLGQAFANGRIITLFVLALPALGLLERYGLQEEARRVIQKIRAATAGGLMLVYHLFRTGVVGIGIRLGSGHVAFSRPMVVPMGLAAGQLEEQAPDQIDDVDRVKAAASASENYANFFGQNLFFGSPGVALVVKNLADHGYVVNALHVAMFSIPVAVVAFLVATAQYILLDRWLRRRRDQRAASAAHGQAHGQAHGHEEGMQ
jgi:uncharacterized membrane protein